MSKDIAMKTLLLFLLLGAVAVLQIEACAQCATNHPQQHYCQADFAVLVKIISSETDETHTKKINTAKVIDNMKLGKKTKGKIIEFGSPSSFCGTVFVPKKTYVITGSMRTAGDGSTYLFHDSCDYGQEWDDLSAQIKKGFEQKYDRYCGQGCKIQESRTATEIKVDDPTFHNTYANARTFWSPTECYYNPHKSREFYDNVEDCEEEFGYCSRGEDGECSWQLTPLYEDCFNERDDFVLPASGAFAITDPEQCQVLPRRKRKKCRKEAKKNAELLAEQVIETHYVF